MVAASTHVKWRLFLLVHWRPPEWEEDAASTSRGCLRAWSEDIAGAPASQAASVHGLGPSHVAKLIPADPPFQ